MEWDREEWKTKKASKTINNIHIKIEAIYMILYKWQKEKKKLSRS